MLPNSKVIWKFPVLMTTGTLSSHLRLTCSLDSGRDYQRSSWTLLLFCTQTSSVLFPVLVFFSKWPNDLNIFIFVADAENLGAALWFTLKTPLNNLKVPSWLVLLATHFMEMLILFMRDRFYLRRWWAETRGHGGEAPEVVGTTPWLSEAVSMSSP